MAPERVGHTRMKSLAFIEFRRAVEAAAIPCKTFMDGVTVQVGDDTNYEPDVVVNCGERLDDDAIAAPNPVIVVEVLSPSTRAVDTGSKLTDYFLLPSVQHYVILRSDRRVVVHHRRNADGGIDTRLLTQGDLSLDPPGVTVAIERLFASA